MCEIVKYPETKLTCRLSISEKPPDVLPRRQKHSTDLSSDNSVSSSALTEVTRQEHILVGDSAERRSRPILRTTPFQPWQELTTTHHPRQKLTARIRPPHPRSSLTSLEPLTVASNRICENVAFNLNNKL